MVLDNNDVQLEKWENLHEVSAIDFLGFTNKFLSLNKDEFSKRCVAATVSESKKFKNLNELKSGVLALLIKKLEVNTSCSLVLANSTSVSKIASDLYTLSECYSEGKLKIEFLTLSFHRSVAETNAQILEEVQNMATVLQHLKEKSNNGNYGYHQRVSPKKKKRRFSHIPPYSEDDSDLALGIENDQNEVQETVTSTENVEVLQDNEAVVIEKEQNTPDNIADNNQIADERSVNTSLLNKDVLNSESNVSTTKTCRESHSTEKAKESLKNKYSNLTSKSKRVSNKNENNHYRDTNSKASYSNMVKLTCENGQSRIVNNSKENDGYIISNGKKRQNRTNLLAKGKAVSEVRDLKATSKPFCYHIGQWDLNTNFKRLKAHISSFAQIIDLVELNTHIQRRYFRSYKLTVESSSKDNILNGDNWPGGIEIKRWWPQKINKRSTVENLKVSRLKPEQNKTSDILENVVNNVNKANIFTNFSQNFDASNFFGGISKQINSKTFHEIARNQKDSKSLNKTNISNLGIENNPEELKTNEVNKETETMEVTETIDSGEAENELDTEKSDSGNNS